MYQKEIRLSQESVKKFVAAASRCNFPIQLCYDQTVVNAKSIMGVYSLDLSNDLIVEYQKRDEAFESVLNSYAVS